MDDAAQAEAYGAADFSEPHGHFVDLFEQVFGRSAWHGPVLDLGCGTADVTLRFAERFPEVDVDGIDGAEAMLRVGAAALARRGPGSRISLHRCYLPDEAPPRPRYGAIISNSLLHHLHDPLTLWRSIRAFAEPGAPVLVMDLLRPSTPEDARVLVERHAAGEAEVLRRDFFNSLLAAYRPDEVARQLHEAGLGGLQVSPVGDRHWIARGRVGSGV